MIYLVRLKHGDETIDMAYREPESQCYVVTDLFDCPVAYIWGTFTEDHFYVDMFYVIQKGAGKGRSVIFFLFNEWQLHSMSGEVLRESGDAAYHFWNSLGATMSVVPTSIEDRITFCLPKEDLA